MTCRKCSIHKKEQDFARNQTWCKSCMSEYLSAWRSKNPNYNKDYTSQRPENHRVRCRSWQQKNPDKMASYRRKSKYNLIEEEYISILNRQGGTCGICSHDFKQTPQVDHCHYSGKIRGLLCMSCNILLGYYEKLNRNPELSEKVKKYCG